MKTIALAVTATLALVATGVSAAPEAAPPRYSQIVAGSPVKLPTKKEPAAVGARETAPGIYLFKPERSYQGSLEVLGTPPADLPAENTAAREQAMKTCFAETYHRDMEMLSRQAGDNPDWIEVSSLTQQLSVYRKTKEMPQGGVTAVHAERFEDDAAKGPRLEMTDAWVDPATRGVRLIGQKTMPLSLIGKSSYGVRVFASRDDSGSAKRLQLVVVPDDPSHAVGPDIMAMRSGAVNGMVNSMCGHIRLSVPIDDDGATARFRTTVVVEDEPGTKKEAAPPPAPVRFKGRIPKRVKLSSSFPAAHESKVRDLTTSVSVSKTARDPEPVIAVSFGWDGRETTERHF